VKIGPELVLGAARGGAARGGAARGGAGRGQLRQRSGLLDGRLRRRQRQHRERDPALERHQLASQLAGQHRQVRGSAQVDPAVPGDLAVERQVREARSEPRESDRSLQPGRDRPGCAEDGTARLPGGPSAGRTAQVQGTRSLEGVGRATMAEHARSQGQGRGLPGAEAAPGRLAHQPRRPLSPARFEAPLNSRDRPTLHEADTPISLSTSRQNLSNEGALFLASPMSNAEAIAA
jgi:hypothetical protein